MRVIALITPDGKDATSWYRGWGPFSALRPAGILPINIGDSTWNNLSIAEGVVIQRPFGKKFLELGRDVCRSGQWLWLDFDDNVLQLHPSNPAYHIYDPQEAQATCELMSMATVITVTNEALRELYLPYSSNRNVIVVPNAVDTEWYAHAQLPAPCSRQIITWRGSATHQHSLDDVEDAVTDMMLETTAAAANRLWMFFGAYPYRFFDRHDIPPGLWRHERWTEVPECLLQHISVRPSVHWVALRDHPFDRCRSNIAWLEATMAGAVTVCPDWWHAPGSYQYTGGSRGNFEEALRAAVEDPDNRVRHQQSLQAVLEHYTLKQTNTQRLKILDRLWGRRKTIALTNPLLTIEST